MRIVQGWGMTETSPLAAVAHPPASVELGTRRGDGLAGDAPAASSPASSCASSTTRATRCRGTARRSARSRCAGRGSPASYYGDPSPEKFDDGWLRTGDVGTVNAHGYVQITDRAKDVIKSGGEWITSVELENHLMAHPDVVEASVIGVPDPRWEERPLACVVRQGRARDVDAAELAAFLGEHGREVAGARAVELHRRGAEDERRQVRQEGAARPPREGRARHRDNWIERTPTGRELAATRRRSGVDAAPAATVVLLRDGDDGLEVLLARRSSKLAFHGGAWVFPGGRIDPDDYGDAPDDLVRGGAPGRGPRGEGGSGRRRRCRRARAPLELDDARDLAQALRDVVLRRRGRGRRRGRRRRPRPTQLQWFRPDEALAAHATPARSSSRRRSTSRCSGCATTRPSPTRWPAIARGDADRLHAPLPLHRRRRRGVRLPRGRRVRRPRRSSTRPAPATASTSATTGWEYVRD